MYKDELIQLHQFLVYVLKNMDEEYELKEECKDYLGLNISPHHIHGPKQNINMQYLYCPIPYPKS